MSTRSTKKAENERDTMRTEYQREDLGNGVRGRYLESFETGTDLVLLSPEVAKAFPDSDSVNEALRGLLHIAERATATKPTPEHRNG